MREMNVLGLSQRLYSDLRGVLKRCKRRPSNRLASKTDDASSNFVAIKKKVNPKTKQKPKTKLRTQLSLTLNVDCLQSIKLSICHLGEACGSETSDAAITVKDRNPMFCSLTTNV